ncbi:methylenetetrahydrofolate reductase [Coralliovum pocilloporae]|uniref:methylenetetrahydrofolate reductase n=1 Tax=Coralliovum pocilloporae TaxID=3066369 RepID=UPI003306B78A
MANLNTNGKIRSSIEVSPKQAIEKEEIYDAIPRGERVYITDIGTASEDMIIAAAKKVTDKGFVAVPHFPARRFQSHSAFETRIKTMTQECGVTSLLTIAGEADKPGPFKSTIDLFETGLFDECGIKSIAVAGHPEGAPDIKPDVIKEFLQRKNEIASNSDADFVIATQFGFDPERVIAWLDEIQSWGNTFPVHIGIAGPAKMTTLVKYAGIAGVSNSMNFLKKRGGALLTMLTSYNPDDVVAPLEKYLAANPDSPLAQMHVYPFGGVAKCAEWLYERGTWENNAAAA